MVNILPFIGTRYNPQLIEDLKLVLSPSDEALTPEEQKELYKIHPNNAVRFTLGASKASDDEYNNKYTRSANYVQSWKRDGLLVDDDKKSFYIYKQTYKAPDGQPRTRTGIYALIKLDDLKDGNIAGLKPECICQDPDSLKLMRTAQTNFHPVFMLYSDPKNEIGDLIESKASARHWMEINDSQNVNHQLWVINKKDFTSRIVELFKDKKVFLAEGYHKFNTALTFQKEMREATGKTDGNQPFDYIMVYMTNFENPGLIIHSTNTILKNAFGSGFNLTEFFEDLEVNFEIEKFKVDDNIDKATEQIAKYLHDDKEITSYVLLLPGNKAFHLKLQNDVDVNDLIDNPMPDELKKLDISILNSYIISQVWVGNPEYELDENDIIFASEIKEGISLIREKKGIAGFFLKPLRLEQLRAVADKGLEIPIKSIFFHPRIPTGIVLRDMTNKW